MGVLKYPLLLHRLVKALSVPGVRPEDVDLASALHVGQAVFVEIELFVLPKIVVDRPGSRVQIVSIPSAGLRVPVANPRGVDLA